MNHIKPKQIQIDKLHPEEHANLLVSKYGEYKLVISILKTYSHKMKHFKSVFYCYVHQLTYQNTTYFYILF